MKIRNVESLLDMGTGGGEFLSLLQPLPPNTYATEGYAPNVPIAKERLESLGVKVYAIIDDDENANLPFEDNQFDLIINKHESYTPNEIFRILKGGVDTGSFCGTESSAYDIINTWRKYERENESRKEIVDGN